MRVWNSQDSELTIGDISQKCPSGFSRTLNDFEAQRLLGSRRGQRILVVDDSLARYRISSLAVIGAFATCAMIQATQALVELVDIHGVDIDRVAADGARARRGAAGGASGANTVQAVGIVLSKAILRGGVGGSVVDSNGVPF